MRITLIPNDITYFVISEIYILVNHRYTEKY